MSTGWSAVDDVVRAGIPDVTPAAVLCVLADDRVAYEHAYGLLSPEPGAAPATTDTLFDLASITKVFTSTLFLTLVDEGRVALDTPVVEVLPEFAGVRPLGGFEQPLTGETIVYPSPRQEVDAGLVTFRHLLTHTSGLADWLPLYRESGRQAALELIYRHPFAYPPGAQTAYSDLGLILVGEAIARIAGQPLDRVIWERVCEPLGLRSVHYRPVPEDGSPCPPDAAANIAPTEICRWRGRRLWGEVDDENTGRLGGIAGHAGLFATARDVAALGRLYLDGGVYRSKRILREETARLSTRHHSGTPDAPRGLGWMLRPSTPEAARANRGASAFSRRAFGHLGFTGGSLWVDPERSLVYVLLTNRIYHGREQDFRRGMALQDDCGRAVVSRTDLNRQVAKDAKES